MSNQEFRKYIDIVTESEDPIKKQVSLAIADGINQVATTYEENANEVGDDEDEVDYVESLRSDAADFRRIADVFATQGYDAGWDSFLLDTEPREVVLESLSQILSDEVKAAIERLGTGDREYHLQ